MALLLEVKKNKIKSFLDLFNRAFPFKEVFIGTDFLLLRHFQKKWN